MIFQTNLYLPIIFLNYNRIIREFMLIFKMKLLVIIWLLIKIFSHLQKLFITIRETVFPTYNLSKNKHKKLRRVTKIKLNLWIQHSTALGANSFSKS